MGNVKQNQFKRKFIEKKCCSCQIWPFSIQKYGRWIRDMVQYLKLGCFCFVWRLKEELDFACANFSALFQSHNSSQRQRSGRGGFCSHQAKEGIKLANSRFALLCSSNGRFCTLLKIWITKYLISHEKNRRAVTESHHPTSRAPSDGGKIQGFEVFPPFFICLESVYPWAGSKKRSTVAA